KNVLNVARKKLPFGIAQIGKAFRNEITPGKFTFRTREFEQMEIEYFVNPKDADTLYDKWVQDRHNWYLNLGVKKDNLRLRPHESDELAHYAKMCKDIEYKYPWGWSEVEGIANRTDFDLSRHQEVSGKDLTYFDEEKNEHFIPFVIEPSGGVDRATLTFLVDAYAEDEAPDDKGKMEKRTVLKLHKDLAPYKIAVLPLSKKEPLAAAAQKITSDLRKYFMCEYDDRGSIGKRYRRQDEIGTPFAVTVDFQTIEEDNKVTIRDRDTMVQERVSVDNLVNIFKEKFKN
ncbi:MAG: glycine--tRNA ligase, partial [Armatimonadota bacterium]